MDSRLPSGVSPHGQRYVSTVEFAELAGITRRAASYAIKECMGGRNWRGTALRVREIEGNKGRGGRSFEVLIASLPVEIRDRISKSEELKPKAVALIPGNAVEWRMDIVGRIIRSGPPGSPERAAMFAQTLATCRFAFGNLQGKLVSERTLYSWMAAYEKRGLLSGTRKRRADRGKARVRVWRSWDRAMEAAAVPAEQQEEIARRLSDKVRSFWASGASSTYKLQRMMIEHCRIEALAAGIKLSRSEMDRLCLPPANFVAEPKRRRARLAHVKRTDAGGYHSNIVSRVRRHRDGLAPMDMVAADVRHSDIMVRRADGSLATPKMIAFLDLATNRLFSRVFLMPKGEMIRREHVLSTLRDLMADPSWGVPRGLYIDNGGEFKWGEAADDLAELATLVRGARSIDLEVHDWDEAERRLVGTLRSRPYNPQSKVIEGTFSNFTRTIEPMFPGFVGGNRMAKKVENQGRAPVPMPGDDAAIREKLAVAVSFYNALPQQKGHIAGKSPFDAFDAAVTDGWAAVVLNPGQFELVFGKNERRRVQAGGEVQINNRFYRHDELGPLVGERVIVQVPILGNGSRVVVLNDKGGYLCVAPEVETYAIHDLAGLREHDRRRRDVGHRINATTKGVEKLDLPAEMARFVHAQVRGEVPEPLATITIDPVIREAAEAPAQPPIPQRSRHAIQADAMEEMLRHAG